MSKHPIRAAEYRARAVSAAEAGLASSLAHVRAKHERAATVWSGLAAAEDARETERTEAAARTRQKLGLPAFASPTA